jgi:glucose-6-phosphate dehydrogenase assembly protein OpcA
MSVAMFNLVVYIDDPKHRAWVYERAQRIAGKRPSRLIILDACEKLGSAADEPCAIQEANASSTMTVSLAIGKLDAAVVVELIRDLSSSGAPTILWWSAGQLIENTLFTRLIEHVDRVVVDASGTSGDAALLYRLLCFVQPLRPLQDLAWMRLGPWREIIAQFFDDPAMREDLASLTSLAITSGSTAEALYLGGWLASRLHWTPSTNQMFHTRDGLEIAFKHITEGEKRRVVRVVLATAHSRYVAQLSADDRVVELSIEGANAKPQWFFPLHSIDNATLIERAVLTDENDELFTASLQTLRALLG